MLNCRETAKLVSDSFDRRLSLWQRMNVWLHLMTCRGCSNYRRQAAMLNRLIRRRFAAEFREEPPAATPECPETVKRRMTEAIRRQIH